MCINWHQNMFCRTIGYHLILIQIQLYSRRKVKMITEKRCCLLACLLPVYYTLRCTVEVTRRLSRAALVNPVGKVSRVGPVATKRFLYLSRSTPRLNRISWCATSSIVKSLQKMAKPLLSSGVNLPQLSIVSSFGFSVSWRASLQHFSLLSYLVTIVGGSIPSLCDSIDRRRSQTDEPRLVGVDS